VDVKIGPVFAGMFLLFVQFFLLLMAMKTRTVLMIAAALALLASCGEGRKERLSRGDRRLARVVAELTLLRERVPSEPAYSDSARALLIRRKITPDGFARRFERLNEKPERWAAFYSEVRAALDSSKFSATAPR
jgi:hypothetical protein